MEHIKQKVFKVLSRTLTEEAFEQWLYNDPYVVEHLSDDELVLDLMNLDYRSKFLFNDLEALVLKHFSIDECLLTIIELSFKAYTQRPTEDGAYDMFYNISLYFKWDEDYGLMESIKNLHWDYDLACDGIYSMAEVLESTCEFSRLLLDNLECADPETRKRILFEGIDMPSPRYYNVFPRKPKGKPLYLGRFLKEAFLTCFRFFIQQPLMKK